MLTTKKRCASTLGYNPNVSKGGGLALYRCSRQKTPTEQAPAPDSAQKVVRANEFVLEDENGKMQASLSVIKEATILVLLDHNGKVRVSLSVDKDGPGLFLSDDSDRMRVVLRWTRRRKAKTP